MSFNTTHGALRLSASAGSGKTYSLTQLYIRKALLSPSQYKGMVAITFTNKAAGELKERILQKLYALTQPIQDQKEVSEYGFDDPSLLRQRATEVLQRILHDYDYFTVTTIDSFFQSIFSQLAYEINLPQGLQPDLDIRLVKLEVLDMGMKELEGETQQILLENVMELLNSKGKGWRSAGYIEKQLLENLFTDEVVNFQLSATEDTLSGPAIAAAKDKIGAYALALKKSFMQAAQRVVDSLSNYGISVTQLDPVEDKSFISSLQKIKRMAEGYDFIEPGKKQKEGKFHAKPKSIRWTSEIEDAVSPALIAMGEGLSLSALANYTLASEAAAHLSTIRLLVYFRQVLKLRNEKAKRYLLMEVKHVLAHMIGADNDVPYLYERIGNQIHTLLIDEFQDTDPIQWKVILPLAKAILDNGGFFAVVGDVKQSIYGWRGADSGLFKTGLDKDLPGIQENSLPFNYRSAGKIIYFNNWLFQQLANSIPDLASRTDEFGDINKWKEIFKRNYEDNEQNIPKKTEFNRENGFVEVRVRTKKAIQTEEDEENEGLFGWIIPEIKRLQDAGIPAAEIGILVRNNKHVNEIVSELDQARQSEPGYDFSYSAAAESTNADHPVHQFLSAALEACVRPTDYWFRLMISMAQTLEITTQSSAMDGESAQWTAIWKSEQHIRKMKKLALTDRLNYILNTFSFHSLPRHDYAVVHFRNLLLRYLYSESKTYADFNQWWTEKASQEKQVLPELKLGIQVLTIHKSKGLDFGVVILAIQSTSKGDDLHNFTFWINQKSEPWNAYPLLKANARKMFIDSDLGGLYADRIYAAMLENLNLWYVACTRSKLGLIIDIDIDFDMDDLDKSPGRWTRIPFIVPYLIGSLGDTPEIFPGAQRYEPDAQYQFRFSYGQVSIPHDDPGKKNHDLLPATRTLHEDVSLPWRPAKEATEASRIGSIIHTILERTRDASHWEGTFKSITAGISLPKTEIAVIFDQLQFFFNNSQVKDWFSDHYISFSEQEMLTESGKILRADRILHHRHGIVLLDFKTGVEMEIHLTQIAEYAKIIQSSTDLPVESYLIYLQPIQIIRV